MKTFLAQQYCQSILIALMIIWICGCDEINKKSSYIENQNNYLLYSDSNATYFAMPDDIVVYDFDGNRVERDK